MFNSPLYNGRNKMARHKVEICGVNTANIKVLTNDEIVDLFKRYQSGDKFAKEDLVNGNLKLVLSILKKYNNRTDNMDDLFQVGCIGLIKAIEKFDPSKNVKFISYAIWWVKNGIQEFIKKRQIIIHIEREEETLNGDISTSYISDDEDESVTRKDTMFSNDSDSDSQEISKNQKKVVYELLKNLSERERYIIECYYGIGGKREMNLEEIGKKLNLTKERVRQIKATSLSKLRSDILLLDVADLIFS